MSASVELSCSKSALPDSAKSKRMSMVDGLLFEIYDRHNIGRSGHADSSFDSDTISTSEAGYQHSRRQDSYSTCSEQIRYPHRYTTEGLSQMSLKELRQLAHDLDHKVSVISSRLVRQLKRRDHRIVRLQKNSDVLTAFLQASSLKRREDMKLKFTMAPKPGEEAFQQWREAMRAVTRLPLGFPPEFRRKVWLALANHYIDRQCYDWNKVQRQAFNERCTPDDCSLDAQIVKDLHRTGCDRFCSEADRAALKRVLLAYARWNKRVGYCQGFNVLAALILEVVDRREDEALKIMVFLVDYVLPESYFAQNLQALSVDMAVFRDLLRIHSPVLAAHLDALQKKASETNVSTSNTGRSYEPPLTNVFTMQWFLTLFATCLPENAVLRVWDSVMLEGSEVMLRTAVVIWEVLTSYVLKAQSADHFYELMRDLTESMNHGELITEDDLIRAIYSLAPFPYTRITELRERYTYNITPFASAAATMAVAAAETAAARRLAGEKRRKHRKMKKNASDEEEEWEDDDSYDSSDGISPGCFTAFLTSSSSNGVRGTSSMNTTHAAMAVSMGHGGAGGHADISAVGPGAVSTHRPDEDENGGPYGSGTEGRYNKNHKSPGAYLERMSTDLSALQSQYHRLRNRQRRAALILSNTVTTSSTALNVGAGVAAVDTAEMGRIQPGQRGTARLHRYNAALYSPPPLTPDSMINHLFFVHPAQHGQQMKYDKLRRLLQPPGTRGMSSETTEVPPDRPIAAASTVKLRQQMLSKDRPASLSELYDDLHPGASCSLTASPNLDHPQHSHSHFASLRGKLPPSRYVQVVSSQASVASSTVWLEEEEHLTAVSTEKKQIHSQQKSHQSGGDDAVEHADSSSSSTRSSQSSTSHAEEKKNKKKKESAENENVKQKTLLERVKEARRARGSQPGQLGTICSPVHSSETSPDSVTETQLVALQEGLLDLSERLRQHHERLATTDIMEEGEEEEQDTSKTPGGVVALPQAVNDGVNPTAEWVERLHNSTAGTSQVILQPQLPLALHSFYRRSSMTSHSSVPPAIPESCEVPGLTQSVATQPTVVTTSVRTQRFNSLNILTQDATSRGACFVASKQCTYKQRPTAIVTPISNPFPMREHLVNKNRIRFGSQFGLYKSISKQNSVAEEP